MSEAISRRRLFGWLAAAVIAVTAPALVAFGPAEAQTDRRHGASAITTPRAAHGSANAAHGSSCRAGLPARRSSRRDVNHLLSAGPPQWGGLVMDKLGSSRSSSRARTLARPANPA